MPETHWTNINRFLLIAFGISWASAFMMRYSQIEYGSPESLSILAFFFMPAPAIAAFITQRILSNGSMHEIGFTLKGVSWIWALLFTPLLYLAFFIATLVVVYLLGNQLQIAEFGHLDFSNEHFFEYLRKTMKEQQNEGMFPLEKLEQMPVQFAPLVLIAGLFVALIAGYTINLPMTLGEELGWRGLLLNETRHWGFWKSNLFIGSIWGLWHGPIIMMGHNYPNYPIAGIGMMVLFCISISFILSYIRIKSNTVFGPAAFHGMINGSAGITLMLIVSSHELVGSIAGMAGVGAAVLLLGYILLFDRNFIAEFPQATPPDSV